MEMNNNEIDKAIEEGLAEIDKETMEDEEIREIARLLKDELVRQTQIRVTDLNGNWQLTYQISSDKKLVRLYCYNETRMTMAPNYRPLVIDGEVDEDYGPEEALEAVITAFVAKQYNKFIVEELKD